MKVVHDLDSMRKERRPVILAAGFFDGVHRGHQRLVKLAMAEEKKGRGAAWVMTFDAHPMKVLCPGKAPLLLTSIPHKFDLLKSLGIGGCVVIPFTGALAGLDPESFIKMLKRSIPTLRLMVVGRNWTFGRGGQGTADDLKSLARLHAFNVRVSPPVCRKGKPISSTRIRCDIAAGRLDEAARMLGRPPSISGTVIKGRGVGVEIGFPTANIEPHNEVYPPNGVYAAQALMGGKKYSGILNLGARPTLASRLRTVKQCDTVDARPSAIAGSAEPERRVDRVLEIHIFDMRRNLYHKQIEVFFLEKLRNERRFRSVEALQQQIGKDMEQARAWLAGKKRI